MKLMLYLLLAIVIEQTLGFAGNTSVCDEIAWVSRAEWKARNATEPPGHLITPVHHVFIHHTESPPECHNQTACAAAVRSIQNFHIDGRKWDDIGYSFVMGGDDRIYEARGWYAIGAHTLGINDKSIAISLIGNYDKVDPPKAMLDLAQKWIQCAVEKGVLVPDYELHGHRDQTCTTCPGQHLYDIIKKWKQFKGGKLATYVCKSG